MLRIVRAPLVDTLLRLQAEEAVFRTEKHNYFIIGRAARQATVVLGLSGQPDQVLDVPRVLTARLPVVKRFSGGGHVVVDSNSLLVSFVFGRDILPHVDPYPRPIMNWSGELYQRVFARLGLQQFHLLENDYVLRASPHAPALKFAGNAQCLSSDRWVHHTSFLWDFEPSNMTCLRKPAKAPEYRAGREHDSFLTCLREWCPWHTIDDVEDAVVDEVRATFGPLQEVPFAEIVPAVSRTYLPRHTRKINLENPPG
eukprot:gnl/Spiro4/7294_TR3816_c0_g1_i2.p1 gnl/Spiro4/7294_TR3816_c0_g1~~gnl/Spiro4/7294_TR3816_c0_g1_i2.p1  ORF type:complete len:289 (+),score=72.17 gnl/Spiro4/7294_TR3816_c0_g1_i2:104-868(+)